MKTIDYSWADIDHLVDEVVDKIVASGKHFHGVYACARGGYVPATMISHRLDLPMINEDCRFREHVEIQNQILVVDDIVDSGNTFRMMRNVEKELCLEGNVTYVSLCLNILNCPEEQQPDIHAMKVDRWVEFPWEYDEDTVSNVQRRV